MIIEAIVYLIDMKASKTLQGSNLFFSTLLSYINRLIIVKPMDFLKELINGDLHQRGYSFDQFVQGWLLRMDMLVSWEASRINTIAAYTLLPHFSVNLVRSAFPEIVKITLPKLEHELYLKLTDSTARIHSPSKISNPMKQDNVRSPHIIKVRIYEKVSQRYEQMKQEDLLCELDLVENFWQCIRALMAALQIA